MRIILMGNAGAGKSTMARRLIGGDRSVARLSLDAIAFGGGSERRPLVEALADLGNFLASSERWVIEGCYGDLVEAALSDCTELRFLNPGIDTCIAHCLRRPWEPDKFDSPQAQQAVLPTLLDWVRQYEERDDEYGLRRHRQIFERFGGARREYRSVADYDAA